MDKREKRERKLKAKLVERGISVEQLGEMLGLPKSTMYYRIRNLDKIRMLDAAKLSAVLELTDEEFFEIFG